MDEYYSQILRRFLGKERTGSTKLIDETTRQSALIAATSQRTSRAAQSAEPISRKERARYNGAVRPLEEAALIAFAKQNGLWISEPDFNKEWADRKIGRGAEQQVYLSYNGRTVIKVNEGSYHGTWLDYFNRLILHSFLFPSTKYTTIGFTTINDSLAVITEQTFVVLDRGAPRDKVESYLNEHHFVRVKNDDYYNADLGIILEDLHDENVFINEKGNLLFIDPVIYLETIDMGLTGKTVFRFPFAM